MDTELPSDVLDAVHSNRKIEAIKLLRGHRNIDLKESKGIIDKYIEENSHLISSSGSRTESGLGRLLFVGIVIVALYGAYRFLSQS